MNTLGQGRGGSNRGNGAIYKADQKGPALKSSILELEDELARKHKHGQTAQGLPLRPAFGTAGRKVIVRTNYFDTRLEPTQPQHMVYRYSLSFDKQDGLSQVRKRRYVELLLRKEPFSKVVHFSDMSTNIFTLRKLDFAGKQWLGFEIILYHRLEEPPKGSNPKEPRAITAARLRRTRRLRVAYANSYNLDDLYSYFLDPHGHPNLPKGDYIQAMNIIFNHFASVNQRIAVKVGNKFFPLADHKKLSVPDHPLYEGCVLGQGMAALRGYYSSIRLGYGRILLNVNVRTGAFCEAVPLDQLLDKFMQGRSYTNKHHISLCNKLLKGMQVATSYLKEKDSKGNERVIRKIYTIRGFTENVLASDQAKFELQENGSKRMITVAAYFATKYQRTLSRPELPVVNCGTDKDKVLIPPELCIVIAGCSAHRLTATADQAKNMINFAVRPPNVNAGAIEDRGLQVMNLAQNQQQHTIGKAGIQLNTNMLTVPARILDPLKVDFKKECRTSGGSWNLENQIFCKASNMNGIFTGLRLGPKSHKWKTEDFKGAMNRLATEIKKYGVNHEFNEGFIREVDLNGLNPSDPGQYQAIMENLDAKFAAAKQVGVKWIVVMIPKRDGPLYAIIKYLCDYRHGIHTNFIQDATMARVHPAGGSRGDLMILGNLALKLSSKSGGQPWSLKSDDIPLVRKSTMVIGLDVTHPSPSSKKGAPSIAAIVWSKDPKLSSWPAAGMEQTSRMEMIEVLPALLGKALKSWKSHNGNNLPDEILVYRDGVSDGQFRQVCDIEVPLMRKAFQEFDKDYEPKVSIIVCQKRHETRFFPMRPEDSDVFKGRGSYNTAPGTVVDRHITGGGEGFWDFYIQAHKAIKGTARPCRYSVIKNDTGMTHADLEKTTHSLCYGFYRATKAVSLCAPAYYADLAAERFRKYLYQDLDDDAASTTSYSSSGAAWKSGVHRELDDSMFYI